MKTILSLISLSSLLVAFILFSNCTSQRIIAEKPGLRKEVNTNNFAFVIDHCSSARFGDVYLHNGEELRIKNDSIYANLPFFGIAHTAPIDPLTGGITFSQKINNLLIKEIPMKGWRVELNVQNTPFSYRFRIEIAPDGKSVISVTSPDRSAMTYYGEVK